MRRHGISDFATSLSAAQFAETYPAILRRKAYRTAFLGKYTVGSPTGDGKALALLEAEFDYWLGFPQSINFRQSVDGTVRHLTPLIANRTIEFLASTPTSKPFCISLNFKELHGPWTYMDPDRPNLYEDAAVTPPNRYTRMALPAFLRNSLNVTENGQWPADSEKEFSTTYAPATISSPASTLPLAASWKPLANPVGIKTPSSSSPPTTTRCAGPTGTDDAEH